MISKERINEIMTSRPAEVVGTLLTVNKNAAKSFVIAQGVADAIIISTFSRGAEGKPTNAALMIAALIASRLVYNLFDRASKQETH